MKKTFVVFMGFAFAVLSVPGQSAASARAAYQQQQALAEVPRLVQQFDLLVQNNDAIVSRLVKLESADATGDVRAEIAALRAEIADLKASVRREQDAMRAAIIRELAGKISQITPTPPPPPPPQNVTRTATPAPRPQPAIGPHYEYIVEKGQTLSLIAQGFDTTVSKIIAANPGLKANALRVGQKLIIPAEETPKSVPDSKKGKKGKK